MALNVNRIRLMKEKANYDVDKQCTRYETECKDNGTRHLSKQEIYDYMKAYDKDKYLRSIGKFEMEMC